MDHQSSRGLQQFNNLVGLKFQLYNSLFTSLPFHRIERTGIMLSLFQNNCEDGYKRKMSPEQIVEEFFEKHTNYINEQERLDLLFRFIQYVERQVVLFDALEDAAFREVNDMNGVGTLKHLESEIIQENRQTELPDSLKNFAVRLVLTAHPTQFYPGAVLGIIHDLARALANNNTAQVNMYLQQLGKTPFFKKQKPTPYDEAVSLIWYLENVFYHAAGRIANFFRLQFPDAVDKDHSVFNMGFWPGGDRDGNPNVNSEITLQVADALRGAIIKCYYLDIRKLKKRLTFKGVDTILSDLEKKLYDNIFIPGQRTSLQSEELTAALREIRELLIYQHNGLFLHLVDELISKVQVFGLHFASLDLRQESSAHHEALCSIAEKTSALPADYENLTEAERIRAIENIREVADEKNLEGIAADTLASMRAMKMIQTYNGSKGSSRYIISQCHSALNVLEVYALYLLAGWEKDLSQIDIIPLFETVDDLRDAAAVMASLYKNPMYKAHLDKRNRLQTIMVGFSDGTKDGGYLMANWSIYRAKEELTRVSKEHGIRVIFFDGRGGPPARGGGKTHKFYASMGKDISNEQIQLTIQGQTVSSNFGTIDSAQFNIEQLLNAGISNLLLSNKEETLNERQETLLQELADSSYKAYIALKEDPCFLDYLSFISPLRFYGETNIGSRPSKRGSSAKLSLKDLRAIPFVGAWSQLKQNVTGFYGVGQALQAMERKGNFAELKELYRQSLYFRTLIDNCEMAMKKCHFPLTEYLSRHPKYGDLWMMIYQEYVLTEKYLFQLTGQTELMAGYPVEQLSIQMREKIVLPITTIQQYAMNILRHVEEKQEAHPLKKDYEKLVIRCSFGIINAGRNSV